MTKWVRRSLAAAGLLFIATSASALPLRATQVVFNGAPLQTYLNIVDAGINVAADQLANESWGVAITGNTDFTLVLKSNVGAGNSVGIYNASDAVPVKRQVFPPNSVPGWYAALHFAGGNCVVTLLDQNSVLQGQSFYPGVSKDNFGFYTLGGCGLWWSQDARNPGAQMLSYSSNTFPGDFWLCWSACRSNAASTFNDVVINIQSVRPTEASNTTWGRLKSQYR